MRKLFFLLVTVSILGLPSAVLKASQRDNAERQMLKTQQKQERNAYKLKERNAEESFRGHQVPRAVRDQTMHQLEREKRAMRDRHKDQLQDLKDRQRMMRDNMQR